MISVPFEARIINIGVSSCLLGEQSRYNSSHKKDQYITEVLGKYFNIVSICPELEVGLGAPREAVNLVGSSKAPNLIGVKTGTNWTTPMKKYSKRRMRQTDMAELDGFILKNDSPSCGIEKVRIHRKSGKVVRDGRGLFASHLIRTNPLLPVTDEGGLKDFNLGNNFIERVFAYRRLRGLFGQRFNRRTMIEFHESHLLQLRSHSIKYYTVLRELIGKIEECRPTDFRRQYGLQFMDILKIKTSPKKHATVMRYILGYLKNHLARKKQEQIQTIINMHCDRQIPLIVPLRMLRFYANEFKIKVLMGQTYLNPEADEIKLRLQS
jgi:uncharacterized protein YbbK (DUF523 family)/uncharacterized protein YbgA (DUF1722 family)